MDSFKVYLLAARMMLAEDPEKFAEVAEAVKSAGKSSEISEPTGAAENAEIVEKSTEVVGTFDLAKEVRRLSNEVQMINFMRSLEQQVFRSGHHAASHTLPGSHIEACIRTLYDTGYTMHVKGYLGGVASEICFTCGVGCLEMEVRIVGASDQMDKWRVRIFRHTESAITLLYSNYTDKAVPISISRKTLFKKLKHYGELLDAGKHVAPLGDCLALWDCLIE